MKKITYMAALLLLPFMSFSQQAVKFSYVGELLSNASDTTYVINFWATWCKPCVHELPLFEKLNEEVSGKKIKVLLVSLDFSKQLESRLIPFVKQRNIKAEVVLLNEPDYDAWIDKVDSSWMGGIPATLIINNAEKTRVFLEREVEPGELEKLLNL